MRSHNIFILVFIFFSTVICWGQGETSSFQNDVAGKKTHLSIYSGIGYNKVYAWTSSARAQFKFDPRIIGFGLTFSSEGIHTFHLNFMHIYKGARVSLFDDDYIYKYSILNPTYKISVVDNKLSIYAGIYLGYLHAYIKNKEVKSGVAMDFDLGSHFGIEYQFLLNENLSLFIGPAAQIGLIRFSNSKQLSLQINYGVRYEIRSWGDLKGEYIFI